MKSGMHWSIGAVGAAILALTTGCNDGSLVTAPVAGDPPTAVITGSQEYGPLDTATFSGASSTAVSPKVITSYEWSISGHPSGSTSQVQSLGSDNSQAEFFVDLAGDYKIKLKVTDSAGVSDTTEYSFSAVPSQSLHVELTWVNQYELADMDLHLIDATMPGASFSDYLTDCFYSNCKPDGSTDLDWGSASNPNDNPTLDIDNVVSDVPENINIKAPVNGTYQVAVHYFASHGASDVTCHVRIFLDGAVAWEGDKVLSAPALPNHPLWTVANVDWSNGAGTVSAIDTITQVSEGN